MTEQDLKFFEDILGDLNSGFGREYNLFSLSQGVEIAKCLGNKEAILEWKDKGFEEQKILVPALDNGHSGNTFGMAVRAAITYLPQLLVNKRDEKIDSIIL